MAATVGVALASPTPTSAARVASVRVADVTGAAVDSATVFVSLVPMNGHRVSDKPRKSKTNSRGVASFALSLSREEQRAAADNNQWLNYNAIVVDAEGIVIGLQAFPKYVGSDPEQLAEAAWLQADGSQDVVTRPGIATASRDAQRSAFGSPSPASNAVVSSTPNCSYYYWEEDVSSRTWAYTRIGELHAQADYSTARYQYGSNADSNIDVGAKATGQVWTVSGSVHIGESIGAAYGQLASGTNYNWGVEAPFDYTTAFLYCDGIGGNHVYQGQMETWSTGYHNGYGLSKQIIISQPTRNPSYTTIIFADGTWSRFQSKTTKISGAVSLFGFSFGAQTGATTNADWYYAFGHAVNNHYIYGNNAKPETAGRVFQSNT